MKLSLSSSISPSNLSICLTVIYCLASSRVAIVPAVGFDRNQPHRNSELDKLYKFSLTISRHDDFSDFIIYRTGCALVIAGPAVFVIFLIRLASLVGAGIFSCKPEWIRVVDGIIMDIGIYIHAIAISDWIGLHKRHAGHDLLLPPGRASMDPNPSIEA
jgi:hypothetical protein